MTNMTISKSDAESIVSLFNEGSEGYFLKGDLLVQGDEKPSGVFFIKSGYVRAYSISQLGQENLLLSMALER